jgi:hypothetical protein
MAQTKPAAAPKAAPKTEPHHLTDDQLKDMLALASASDSVELKLTVPENAYSSTANALGMDPLEAQIRQVFFFDTPDLKLNHAGLVVRARRIQGSNDDSVVKLRPVDPTKLPKKLRESISFGVEVDAMPGGYVCSGSMKGEIGKRDVRAAVFEGRPIRKLFNKDQRAFFDEHVPEGLTLDTLSILGPINVFKLKFQPSGSKIPMVAEFWLFPDNTSVLELSTKCPPKDAMKTVTRLRTYLTGKNVSLSGEQSTKTKAALELFSARLVER